MFVLVELSITVCPCRCKVGDNATLAAYDNSCHYQSVDNETLPCTEWEYDHTDYNSTIVSDVKDLYFHRVKCRA